LRFWQDPWQLCDRLGLKRKIEVYVTPMDLVTGMAGELSANVREHFKVSQSANERMPQAVIAERAELTPFTSFYCSMRHSNSSPIHQSAKHVREPAVASARLAMRTIQAGTQEMQPETYARFDLR
jgi:hypothetical protein